MTVRTDVRYRRSSLFELGKREKNRLDPGENNEKHSGTGPGAAKYETVALKTAIVVKTK